MTEQTLKHRLVAACATPRALEDLRALLGEKADKALSNCVMRRQVRNVAPRGQPALYVAQRFWRQFVSEHSAPRQ